MNRIQTLMASDWAPTLERIARGAAAVAALLITIAWLTGDCAYSLGRQLRLAIEARNDQLAAWWVAVLGLAREVAPAAADPAPPASPALPAPPAAVQHFAPIALPPEAAASLQRPARPARRRKTTPAHKASSKAPTSRRTATRSA